MCALISELMIHSSHDVRTRQTLETVPTDLTHKRKLASARRSHSPTTELLASSDDFLMTSGLDKMSSRNLDCSCSL